MKHFAFLLAMLLTITVIKAQNIPYNLTPDWESNPNGQVSTGLGLADINGDGWKDIIVADGNDIYRQHLVVYYNNGDGTFPNNPDWQSADIDYHGHLAVGDINSDGWIDVAVSVYIGPSGFSDPGKVKVYYNIEGELEASPSFESSEFYTFSCALGDADGDGDLDLAAAAGEPYSSLFDSGKIFYNTDGTFEQNPQWTSAIQMGAMDVDFADMDGNGFLDLIFSCEETPNYIYLANNDGIISETPAWYSDENENYMNSLDIGFIGSDTFPAIVMTGNSQLGGDGKVRLYDFDEGIPASSSASWLSNYFGYGSGILLADVTRDDILDLIYGGWWLPIKIAIGNGVNFQLNPSYTSESTSVVEAIQIADLGKENIRFMNENILIGIESATIHLSKKIIENILSIYKNGVLLETSDYSYFTGKNRISFKTCMFAGDELEIQYEYCYDGDLVITNWDSNKGNFIFYNTNPPVGLISYDKNVVLNLINIYPNPANEFINIDYVLPFNSEVEIEIYNLKGEKIKTINKGYRMSGRNLTVCKTGDLKTSLYLLKLITCDRYFISEFLILNN